MTDGYMTPEEAAQPVTHGQLAKMNRAEDQLHDELRTGQRQILECLQGDIKAGTTGLIGRMENLEKSFESTSKEARTATTEVKQLRKQIIPMPNIVKYMMMIAAIVTLFVAPFVPAIMQKLYPKEVPHAESKN